MIIIVGLSTGANVFHMAAHGSDMPFLAYVDTACARGVGGRKAIDALTQWCEQHGWPHVVVADRQPFRFGPGERIWANEALVLAVIWAGTQITIRISVVEKTVPLLISKPILKQLGAVIDSAQNRLKIQGSQSTEELFDLVSGHVGIQLVRNDLAPPGECAQQVIDGKEVWYEAINDQEDMHSCGNDSSSCSGDEWSNCDLQEYENNYAFP